MARRIPTKKTELKLPTAWLDMAEQLALMTGQTRAAYIRGALIRQLMEDWNNTPGRGFWLRPGQPVYARDKDSYTQVTTTLGGERCWVSDCLGYLPASLGGDMVYRCDIVPVGMKQGLSMSDAIVARGSFGGPAAPGRKKA